uniref:Reverse transcriptase n=1 Tax=Panagrolaimus davidi TaxID=227884 RepID=A0A914QM82_9BILA
MICRTQLADTTACTNLNITQPSIPSSEPDSDLVENIPEPSNVKSEIDDNEFCIILNEPSAKKPKLEPSNDEPIFSFNHPSAFTLKDICKKLKIEYSHGAYKFWSDIVFQKIISSPENIQTHAFKSQNIFACFSQFFTGKSDSDFLLYYLINTAFRDDLISTGVLSRLEIDSICSSNIVSDQLLEFVAKFLPCRIGIYENAILKKFGKWETENDALITLILLFENGFYSVVLDLQ